MTYKSKSLKAGQKVKFTVTAPMSYGKVDKVYTVSNVSKNPKGDVNFKSEDGQFFDAHRNLEKSVYEIVN